MRTVQQIVKLCEGKKNCLLPNTQRDALILQYEDLQKSYRNTSQQVENKKTAVNQGEKQRAVQRRLAGTQHAHSIKNVVYGVQRMGTERVTIFQTLSPSFFLLWEVEKRWEICISGTKHFYDADLFAVAYELLGCFYLGIGLSFNLRIIILL